MNSKILTVKEISSDINYWFVRTDKGVYFDNYLENGFIAIGWNEISLSDLRENTPNEVKDKIARTNNFSRENTFGKQRSTDVYNKLIRFLSLRKGDVIIIPSFGTQYLAFGQIADEVAYSDRRWGCDYRKRRKVEWLTERINIDALDPTFYKIKKSRHSISDINQYAYYIDSVLYNLYKKDGHSHFVIKINTIEAINLKLLTKILEDLHSIMSLINNELKLGEDITEGSIRLNLQSPGLLNVKAGKALLLAACLIGAAGCSIDQIPQEEKRTLEQIQDENDEMLDRIMANLDTLNARY